MRAMKAFLLSVLTSKSRHQFCRSNLKTIVVLRYDRIGDMIVSLPLMMSLKMGFPRCFLTVVAGASNSCIARESDFIDEVIVKPDNIVRWILALVRLRLNKPSLVIDLNHAVTTHTILATLLINPLYVASPHKDGRWGVKGTDIQLFDIMPPKDSLGFSRPIAEIYLDIARTLHCPTEGCLPYPLRNYDPCWQDRPYIILNASGSRPTMRFSECDLVSIVDTIGNQNPELTVLLSCFDQNQKPINEQLRKFANVEILEATSDIIPMLGLVQHARLVVTPDTSLVHIAVAYGTPLVAVYTSDEVLFAQWQPINHPRAEVVRSHQLKSIDGFSINEVLGGIKKIIGSADSRRP